MMQLKLTTEQQTKYSAEAEGLKNKYDQITQLCKDCGEGKVEIEDFFNLLIDLQQNEIVVENKDKN